MGQRDCVGQLVWGLLMSWEVRDQTDEPNLVIYTGCSLYRSHEKLLIFAA